MTSRPGNFDRLAAPYLLLERLAFGRDLERARFCYLDRLRDRKSILVLGDGDGRCLAQLVGAAPQARIHSVDASGAMIARARARVASGAAADRVTFVQADALAWTGPAAGYDAVLTCFFLDCFTPEQVAALIARVGPQLRPDSRWVFADFVLPPAGWRRGRARLWVGLLYFCFRLATGISARRLPPSEALLAEAGWRAVETRDFQCGLVRAALFVRRGAGP